VDLRDGRPCRLWIGGARRGGLDDAGGTAIARIAPEGDREALTALADRLADVATPSGPTPNELGNGTAFNGVSLLNGSFNTNLDQMLSANTGNSNLKLNIPDLTSSGLFGSASPNLLTQANAQSAGAILQNASNKLQTTLSSTNSFAGALDVAAASVESAQFNLMAANSGIDFTEETTQLSQLNVQQNAQIALQAQANNIPASILALLSQPIA